MIPAPYGGELVDRTITGQERVWLRWQASQLPRIHLSAAVLANLRLLATGALSPLDGFMGPATYRSVLMDMELPGGLPWTLPVVCPATGHEAARVREGEGAALVGPDGEIAGRIDVEEVYDRDPDREARLLYGSEEETHPGRAALNRRASHHVSGPVTWLHPGDPWSVDRRSPDAAHRTASDADAGPDHPVLTPAATREAAVERGWSSAAAFFTRHPIHRPQEYLLRCALEFTDGVLVQPLVGWTVQGEAPPEVRVRCCRTALEAGFPAERALLSALPAAPRYAGPREAVHHAILARNYGASHVVLGGEHGDPARPAASDLQVLFDRLGAEDRIGVRPMTFEDVFYCRVTGQMATARTSPAGPEDRVHLSGAEIREILARGGRPPETFVRPAVADLLMEAREADAPASADADAPANAEADADGPASAEADAPETGSRDAPPSADADAPSDALADAPEDANVLDWRSREPRERRSSAS